MFIYLKTLIYFFNKKTNLTSFSQLSTLCNTKQHQHQWNTAFHSLFHQSFQLRFWNGALYEENPWIRVCNNRESWEENRGSWLEAMCCCKRWTTTKLMDHKHSLMCFCTFRKAKCDSLSPFMFKRSETKIIHRTNWMMICCFVIVN